MSTYSDQINNINSIPFEKYQTVSSREKLVVYTIKYLKEKNIPTSWNNICIASFKLFPEKFYFSEEFKMYPHIEMLNRTLLHLRPKERNYATGGSRVKYVLTKLGEEIGRQVNDEICTVKKTPLSVRKKIIMDNHKAEPGVELEKLRRSAVYKKFIADEYDDMDVWAYYSVTPFTQIERVKKNINEIKVLSEEQKDLKVTELLDKFLNELKS